MSNRNHGWTKESWLAYKAKAETWIADMMSLCGRRAANVAAAVAKMEDRED